MNKPQLLTKSFMGIFLVNFLVVLNYYLLMVTSSAFAMDKLKAPPSAAGFTSSIFIIGVVIARLVFGRLIERIGRKRTLAIGTFSSLVMALLYNWVNSVLLLFALRFVTGLAFGIASTAAGTIVTRIIPQERRGEGIGYYALSGTFGAAAGPFFGMLMLKNANFHTIFLADGIFIFISLVITLLLAVPEIQLTLEQLQEIKEFKFTSFLETKAIPISIIGGIGFACYASILTFLPAYAKEIRLVDAASFFFLVFSAALLISRPFTGRFFDAKGENSVMYPAILTLMVGIFLLSQAQHGYVLLLAGALMGIGLGAVHASCQTIAVKLTPPHRMGLATSTFYLVLDAGIGIGPFVLGLIIPYSGYRTVYAGAAVVVLACMYLYYAFHGKKALHRKRDLGQYI